MDPLEAFCRKFLSENEENWPPDEKSLAESFAAHFNAPPIFNLDSFTAFCKPLGIEVSAQAIPYELRGYNSVYENQRIILVSAKQDFPSADLQTAFHELREILEYVFRGLNKPTATGNALEIKAENFATSLRMRRTMLLAGMFADGARGIDNKWKRRGAYLLIFVVTMVYAGIDLMVPHFENANRDKNRKS